MVSLGRWAPDRGSPRDGSSAGHTRHKRAEGHQPHRTKHAGIQTGFCKIHHSPSTGSSSNQPMSPGIQLSSSVETQKPIKIKMLGFFKKKKNSVQQSTIFNLFKKKKYGLQEAWDLAGVILIYRLLNPLVPTIPREVVRACFLRASLTLSESSSLRLSSNPPYVNETQFCYGTDWKAENVHLRKRKKYGKETVNECEWELEKLNSSHSFFTYATQLWINY